MTGSRSARIRAAAPKLGLTVVLLAAAVVLGKTGGETWTAAFGFIDEMVLATTLIGTEDMVRARLRAWRDAGVDTVRLYPAGDTLTDRLDTLARGIELVRALG